MMFLGSVKLFSSENWHQIFAFSILPLRTFLNSKLHFHIFQHFQHFFHHFMFSTLFLHGVPGFLALPWSSWGASFCFSGAFFFWFDIILVFCVFDCFLYVCVFDSSLEYIVYVFIWLCTILWGVFGLFLFLFFLASVLLVASPTPPFYLVWFNFDYFLLCLVVCTGRMFCVALVIFGSGINWLFVCLFLSSWFVCFSCIKKSRAFCFLDSFAVFWSSIAFSSLLVSSGLAFAGLLFPFWIVLIIFYKFWLFQWSFLCGCFP